MTQHRIRNLKLLRLDNVQAVLHFHCSLKGKIRSKKRIRRIQAETGSIQPDPSHYFQRQFRVYTLTTPEQHQSNAPQPLCPTMYMKHLQTDIPRQSTVRPNAANERPPPGFIVCPSQTFPLLLPGGSFSCPEGGFCLSQPSQFPPSVTN